MTKNATIAPLALIIVALPACSASEPEEPTPIELPCNPSQSEPYADGIPYLGIHADAGNSDVIRCRTGSAFTPVWHALGGLGVMQPNTFSRDGATTYVTTTNPDPSGCRLHAVDTASGTPRWCASYPGSIARSAVEVDSSGDLYFTVGDALVSVDAQGVERWRTSFATSEGSDAPWGLHFTPQGHVATVTSSGTAYLIDRADGGVLSSFSIPEHYSFVAPASFSSDVDVALLMPAAVQNNIKTVWGEPDAEEDGPGFGSFLGAGDFVDNTLAVSSRGDLYVIGGGPDDQTGALVQIRVSGSPQAPELVAGWYAPTHKGSATSPSISPGDRYVMISDGVSPDNTLKPDSIDARVKVFDVEACDGNVDEDPDDARCAVAYEERLERAAVPGSPAIDETGTVYFYEFGLSWSWSADERDVVAFGPDGVEWSTALPDDLDWTSVVTVTDNHIVGSATQVEPSDESLASLVFPQTSRDKLVLLDRQSGARRFSAPIPDDSAATVTVGPDGALYVGMLGLISILSVGETPTLGLMRFSPTQP